jgi:hypothetical protein
LPHGGRINATSALLKLATDPEPEVAKAASDAIEGR